MRALMFTALVLIAAPAAAQDRFANDRLVEMQAQQDMDRQRFNTLRNELDAADSRIRTEQTIRNLQAEREPLRVRPLAPATAAQTRTPGYATIPDAALADSNARVRDASQGR